MRVLVCGSRTFTDDVIIGAVLGGWCTPGYVIVTGDAKGADAIAHQWARDNLMLSERYVADWDTYAKGAGPIRNQQMLKSGVDVCFAFVDGRLSQSRGTTDMVKRCEAADVPTYVIEKR